MYTMKSVLDVVSTLGNPIVYYILFLGSKFIILISDLKITYIDLFIVEENFFFYKV